MQEVINEAISAALVLTILEQSLAVPSSAIVRDLRVSNTLRMDYAILDTKTGTPLLAFEIKSLDPGVEVDRKRLRDRLQKISEKLSPVVVYFLTHGPEKRLRYFKMDIEGEIVECDGLPAYDQMVASVSARRRYHLFRDQTNRERNFRRKCTGLACLAVVLAFLAGRGPWSPSWQFLAIAAVGALLMLLPDVREIRALGLEISLLVEGDLPKRV
jgi:hypothetical protein